MATLDRSVEQSDGSFRRLRWLRIVLAVPVLLILLIVLMVIGLFLLAAANLQYVDAAPVLALTTQFDGRYLLAASDTDMTGTAYADGVLRQNSGDEDTLTFVELPVTDANAHRIEIPVSNSVTAYSQIIALSPDKTQIYIAETAIPIEDTVERLNPSAFPLGHLVTVIDISQGVDNEQVATIDLGQDVRHIAISPDGAYLAIGAKEMGRQVAIIPTATLDDPATFDYFSIEHRNRQPTTDVSSVFWHPSGQFLAVGVSGEEIQFFRVSHAADGRTSLIPHGSVVGNAFTYGEFTSDGRYYLTSDINWARVPPPLHALINAPSEMVSIRFDQTHAMDHVVASRVSVGQSAEGWAISPQEDLIVTVNMGRTYMPDGAAFWPGAQMNSLSLIAFDRDTGQLRAISEPYGFEGVLPEHAMFDVDGDSLGVVIYNYREDPMGPGVIEFWNVIRDGFSPRLERTAVRLEVMRGPHSMSLIP